MARKLSKVKSVKDIGRIAKMAANMVNLPVGVNPPLLGSCMHIWKQDPTVKEIGIRTIYIHTKLDAGPTDSQIGIQGIPTVDPDANGDYLFDPPDTSAISDIFNPTITRLDEVFDAVHTYAVVRMVLTMYQRVLGQQLNWQWNSESNSEVLRVYPHANLGKNAYYDRTEKALKFFYFFPYGKPPVFTCRSLDLVAHETGHAILDSLKPDWGSSTLQLGGLHESFGDLTSIFLVLSQMDLVEYIIAETKADLHRKNILATWTEQLENIPGSGGPRNADNDLKLSETGNLVHEISKVFTGAVYDILADVFTSMRDSRIQDDAETLYQAGKYMASLTIRAIVNSPKSNASYADVANAMIKLVKADGHSDYAHFIEKHFTVREVLGVRAFAGLDPSIEGDFSGCCGTIHKPQ